jgi:hypothetical protein
MKNLIILILFVNCTQEIKYSYPTPRVRDIFAARASANSIKNSSSFQKQSSCCLAAETTALSHQIHKGKPYSLEMKFATNETKVDFNEFNPPKLNYVTECISRINDFEECYCLVKSQKKELQKEFIGNETDQGWINSSTYKMIAESKASENAISKNSPSMKETSCIEASYLTALHSMYASIAKEKDLNLTEFKIKTNLPEVYLKSCESKDGFANCSCELYLYEYDLKEKLFKEMKNQNSK